MPNLTAVTTNVERRTIIKINKIRRIKKLKCRNEKKNEKIYKKRKNGYFFVFTQKQRKYNAKNARKE